MKVVCIGDSLTYGNVGYSYIPFLDGRIRAINKGKNGDTLRGACARLKRIIDQPRYDTEIYILGIGTNDILLPYLRSLSPLWCGLMSLRCKIMRCIEDDDVFFRTYRELLDFLSARGKRVLVVGMPFVNLRGFPHARLIKRNRLIRELAEAHDFAFIDLYKLQSERLAAERRIYSWKYRFVVRLFDGLVMSLLPFSKDAFARIRGLHGSVDGVHLSAQAARLLAGEIERVLIAE